MKAFARGLVVLILLSPINVLAHAAGASYESVVGDYTVDVGYDPSSVLAGDRIVLDFSIKDSKTQRPVPFRDVWVRVQSGEDLLVATGISEASFGATTLLLRIPENATGNVQVSARFENEDGALAETSFEIPVVPLGNTFPNWSWILLGFFTGVSICAVVLFRVLSLRNERFLAFFKL